MNTNPLILLIPQIFPGSDNILTRPGYMTEVQAAGGIPVLMPPTEDQQVIADLISRADGLLVPGGQDVHPSAYGEEVLPACGLTQEWRDRMEFLALEAAMEAGKPVFCICRGIQTLNVYLGGSLFQDIPTQYETTIVHSMEKPTNRHWHDVTIGKDTPLYELLKQDVIGVNSCHHQAIRRLGKGLQVMAEAPDGIIEAVWMPDRPFVWGVQWHQELFCGEDPNHRKLFEAFVEACRK